MKTLHVNLRSGYPVALVLGTILTIMLSIITSINWQYGIISVLGLSVLLIAFIAPKTYILISFLYILLVPKIGILNVPGTYVAIRGEDLLIALFVVSTLIRSAIHPKELSFNSYTKKLFMIFGAYAFACLMSVLYGVLKGYIDSPLLGFMFFFRKIEYFILFIFGYQYFKAEKTNKKTFIRIIDFSVILLLIIGLLQKAGLIGAFALGQYRAVYDDRIMSTFSGAYEYAGFLLLITPLYIYRFINSKNKLMWLLFLGIIFYSISITQSRVSLVAFLIICFIGTFSLMKKHLKKLLITSYIVTFVAILLFASSQMSSNNIDSSTITERFDSIDIPLMIDETQYAWKLRDYESFLVKGPSLYFAGSDLSYSMRMSKWLNYIDGVTHNPVFGLGLSTTGEAVDGNYIRILAESGLLGFTLWLMVFLYILSKSKELMKQGTLEGSLVYLGLISLFLGAIFIDVFESSKIAMIFWFFTGWAFSNFKKHPV